MVFLVGSVFAFWAKASAASGAEDSIVDKIGDWFATVGKPENEKNMIIAERKMQRAAKRIKSEMTKQGKAFDAEMRKVFGK
jgi:hypothetical protein